MSRKVKVEVDSETCKGVLCYLCINICPVNILEPSDVPSRMGGTIPHTLTPEKCILCRKCEITCPDFAISIVVKEK